MIDVKNSFGRRHREIVLNEAGVKFLFSLF